MFLTLWYGWLLARLVECCLQAKVTGSIPVQPIPANERLDSYLIFILSEVVSLSKTFQRAGKIWVHIPYDHSDQIDHNSKYYKITERE